MKDNLNINNNQIEPTPVRTKKCIRCQEVKHASQFFISKQTKDRLYGYCRECTKKIRRDNYYARNEKYVEKARQLRKTNREEIKEFNRTYQRDYRAKDENKIKHQARLHLYGKIRQGKFDPPSAYPCFYIGCNRAAEQFHHYSYDRRFWLSVIPLCIVHHRMIHRIG